MLLYSVLLILGLVSSQILPHLVSACYGVVAETIRVATMACLAFIMIHVGYEFEIGKSQIRQDGWDYLVAGTAAFFPWVFCAAYFAMVMSPVEEWASTGRWKETLLVARFAAPTSAGVLFSMLAAAGLWATWAFRKVRILAIFDDLDTVLLMIPLKMLLVGLSMPSLGGEAADGGAGGPSWTWILLHVMFITLFANLGKMFPLLCYRREARWRERLAVAVSMFPRGEVGAGVLVVSLSYGIGGPMITVAVLSLALNLLLTGAFIVIVQRLIGSAAARSAASR